MKLKLIALMSLIVLGTVQMSMASGSNLATKVKAGNAADVVAQMVKQKVSFPDFAKQNGNNGTVLVEFELDSMGNVHVLNTNQSDKQFRDYVVTELEKINIGIEGEENATYQMRINFKFL